MGVSKCAPLDVLCNEFQITLNITLILTPSLCVSLSRVGLEELNNSLDDRSSTNAQNIAAKFEAHFLCET